jgi:glycosyltransferase involved in cell wall biosynthesis
MAERLRLAHLTTVDMSLALLLETELRVDVEAGFEVLGLSAPGPFAAELDALGVQHVPIPSLSRSWAPRSDIAAVGELLEALRRLRPHVLHTHTPKGGVLGRILGRAVRVPVVVNTCHGLWVRPDDPLAKRALVNGIEGLAAQFSDAELYQNDTDRLALRRFIRKSKARTVGNGVDLNRFRPDEGAAKRLRAELGVSDDDLLIGGVGRRVLEKGVADFAAAARALSDRAVFVWVGPDDPAKPDALRAAERGVRFLGLRRDMPAVYSALDIFVLPSRREGFSRSAMEAAACGCALVLSDIRGCREIGTHEEELLLVPPADPEALTASISRLVNDPALRARLASQAHARAHAAFDQRAVAAASLTTYRAVARRKGLDWWRQMPEV